MAMTGLQLSEHPLWKKAKLGKDLTVSDIARLRGRIDVLQVEDGAWILDFACLTMEAPLHIGRRAKLMQSVIITAHKPVTICAGAKIGGHVQILAGMHVPHHVASGCFLSGPIIVGTGAVIGPGAILGPGTVIEENGQVLANSLVGIDWDECRPSTSAAAAR